MTPDACACASASATSRRIPHGLRDRQPALTAEPSAQRFAVDVGHDVERQAIGGAGVEERQNVRVAKMRGRPDLGDEAVGADDRRQIALQHFDRDLALVPDIVREIDGRHSSDAELSLDTVSRQKSRRERGGNVRHAGILSKPESDRRSTRVALNGSQPDWSGAALALASMTTGLGHQQRHPDSWCSSATRRQRWTAAAVASTPAQRFGVPSSSRPQALR